MSKNHIKIFDDTVLKLSVNQGLEIHRTATNIGRFTMGELSFTRDTGRLFIGNKSSQDYDADKMTPEVVGGILTGNKYLGYIDSKPLSWWRRGDNGETPLNYDSETKDLSNVEEGKTPPEDSYSKEGFNIESSMLGPDSKYRKKLGRDGNVYKEKWERDAIYNKKYDAYNGDYMYDIYQNALILFDNNISNNSIPNKGVKNDGEINKEQFFDEENNILPIDKQYRRTPILNYNDEHPIYPEDGGYVIFRNIEPDNVTIKFKEKGFDSDGSFNETGGKDAADKTTKANYSHNILEVHSVGATAVVGALNEDQFTNQNNKITLKSKILNVDGFENTSNTFTLPQQINLDGGVKSGTTSFYLDFRKTDETPVSSLTDNDLTFKLVKSKNDQQKSTYAVQIAKPSSSEFFIKLGEGLINTGAGSESYLRLNSSSAGSLDSKTPTISLKVDENTFYTHDNDLDDPFYTHYFSETGNFYNGNVSINKAGTINLIDEYEEDYKKEITSELNKFEVDKNVKTNFLKNPIPLIWNCYQHGYNPNKTFTFDAITEFMIKPYVFCIKKDVAVNGEKLEMYKTVEVENADGTTTSTTTFIPDNAFKYDNSVMVLGNNHYQSLSTSGNYFVIPGFNVDIDFNISDYVKDGTQVLKCNFDAISPYLNNNFGEGYIETSELDDNGNQKIKVFTNTFIKLIKKTNEDGEEAYEIFDERIYNDYNKLFGGSTDLIINGCEIVSIDNDISYRKLSDMTDDDIDKNYCYNNFNSMTSIFDWEIEYTTSKKTTKDKNGNVISDESETSSFISDIVESDIRNNLNFHENISFKKIEINDGIYDENNIQKWTNIFGENASFTYGDENISSDEITSAINDFENRMADNNITGNLIGNYAMKISNNNTLVISKNPEIVIEESIQYSENEGTDEEKQIIKEKSKSYYFISLYYNADILLDGGKVPTTLRFVYDDEYNLESNKDINISKEMPYYDNFTIYKKRIPAALSETTNVGYYYTKSDNDGLEDKDNINKRIIGLIQLQTTEGEIINVTPEYFWNEVISSPGDDISEENNEIFYHKTLSSSSIKSVNISTGIDDEGNHIMTSKSISKLTFINVEEKNMSLDSSKTYIDSDNNILSSDDSSIFYSKFDIESFVITNVYGSKKGYHKPVSYSHGNLYIPSPSNDNWTDEDDVKYNSIRLDDGINNRKILRESISDAVVLPDHAVEAILEVRHKSSSPIAIFSSHNVDLYKDINSSDETRVFNLENIDYGSSRGYYNVRESSISTYYTLNSPSIDESSNSNLLTPNSYEKCILYSDSDSIDIIRVPLYRTNLENGKSFSLRLSGIKPSDTERIIVRLIGYTV